MPRLVRVSFDYDDTLSEQEVREYAENLIVRGFNVWVVTARPIAHSEDVYKTTDSMKISREHVIFTEHNFKYSFLKDIKPLFHLDDNWIEVQLIKTRATNVVPVKYEFNPDWMEECEEALIGSKDKEGFALTPRVQAKKNKKNKYGL